MNLKRRKLFALATGATAMSVNACVPDQTLPSPKPLPAGAASSVDVHCHVFNTHDVPVRKFVELVYLENNPPLGVLDPLLAFLCHIMTFEAPTTEDELAELQSTDLRTATLPGRGSPERRDKAVAYAIQQMLAGNASYDPGTAGGVAVRLAPNPANRTWMLQQLPAARQRRLRRAPALTGAGLDSEARLAAQSLLNRADLKTWIDFAFNYTKARWELTDQLASLSAAQSAEVALYTPAMLDIGLWVGDQGTSDLGQQVKIMSLIAARPGKAYAVHGFVPFDPWRAVDDPSVLATVRDAIENQGCIGVKLYPPMGFKPSGNDASTFPPHLVPPRTGGPALVDQQMEALFKYCLEQDVPIMAHCSHSQFTTDAGGNCPDPLNWRAYLDKAPGNRLLRLNLAHFGGPWDTNGWSETVIEMLGSGRYPNLYSDLGDASFVLSANANDPASTATMERVRGLLDPAKPGVPAARARIMYGSDWSLLAREPGNTTYYADMKGGFCDLLHLSADERRGFLGRTALQFLGLTRNPDGSLPQSRKRIASFRQKNGLSMAVFDVADAPVA